MAIPDTYMGFPVMVAEVLFCGFALDVTYIDHTPAGTTSLEDLDYEVIGCYTSSGDNIYPILECLLSSDAVPATRKLELAFHETMVAKGELV